ncbi:NmrA family NAD(P)-binding protein [Streptomyces albulus]|uniref:NmrA family NAD(P)-binding protein n=1 Tax=Streptomyces noursei TaxID=1971 RepID=UPI001F213D90|nr:NmrA family NAD(P)-binding protein [Streptomyces noursei]MCE4941906.1 NmrA family NAD(P)-binding protein [Streptomyces noursei]
MTHRPGARQREGEPPAPHRPTSLEGISMGTRTIRRTSDNALGGAERIRGGVLDLPLPSDRPLQQLARPDLGAFVAEVLLDPAPYVGQRIELAGDAPTPAQMAATLGAALGREVRHEQMPLTSIGNPDMHAMWTFMNGTGYRVDIPALHAAHPKIPWTSFADWAHGAFAAAG